MTDTRTVSEWADVVNRITETDDTKAYELAEKIEDAIEGRHVDSSVTIDLTADETDLIALSAMNAETDSDDSGDEDQVDSDDGPIYLGSE